MRVPQRVPDLLDPCDPDLVGPCLDRLVPRLPDGLAVLLEAQLVDAPRRVQPGEDRLRITPGKLEK